jgi:hypothetical protein
MRLLRTLTIGGVGVLTVCLWFLLSHAYPNTLVINEVSFDNNEGSDWIELYNPSLSSVSLRGYYLSDDSGDRTKFQITDDVVVPRQGFVVFYGENTTEVTQGIQLSFNIKNGETIYLVAKDGVTLLDRLTVVNTEDDTTSTSIGSFPDGREQAFTFSVSTPGSRNVKDKMSELMNQEL